MIKPKLLLLLLTSFSCNFLQAQSESPDFARSIGKMYVVVAVILAIFIGIVIFLVYVIGKIYRKSNLLKVEQRASAKRNPMSNFHLRASEKILNERFK